MDNRKDHFTFQTNSVFINYDSSVPQVSLDEKHTTACEMSAKTPHHHITSGNLKIPGYKICLTGNTAHPPH